MKNIFITFLIALNCLSVHAALLSKEQAVAILKQQFVGQDVDYYIYKNSKIDSWDFFVDMEPQKG